MGIAENLIRSLWSPVAYPTVDSESFPEQIDVLFISHLVSAQTGSADPDFYYGRLPDQLASRGLSSLVALKNHVPHNEKILRDRLTRGGATSRILLPRSSTFGREIHMYCHAGAVASALRQDALEGQSALQRSVALEAVRNAKTRATIASLRLHAAVKQLCERFRPRALIVTWEGHAWERLAFHAARMVDPSVRCIGYQHTVLLPRAHALKRSLGKSYDPDLILTIADVNRDVLRSSRSLSGIPIVTYGSHRRVTATEQRRERDATTRCIVIPEGIESEYLALFDFVLTAARCLPDFQYVLRMHPVLPFDWLARRYPRFRTLPSNVCVSSQTDISTDFSRCDWALYRGSSAAVHAVLAGVRPVYVKLPGELSIDPLYPLGEWRKHVTTADEFGALIAADRAATSDDRRREWEPARAFCNRYVVAPDPDIVLGVLTD